MAYELAGKLKIKGEPQTFASGFTKLEFVVTVEDGKYPQDIALELLQDKVSVIDAANEGDAVSVKFDIRGREYNGRYFNNLVCWSLAVDGQAESDRPELPADFKDSVQKAVADAKKPAEFEDDIPF